MVYFSCLSSFCLPCRCHSSLALVQEEIQKGVVVDTQDDAYSRLESFGS
jgi:hypothetical protein